MILIVVVYFLPIIVAIVRNHNVGMIMLINLFLGWTGFGWLIALGMALGRDNSKPVYVVVSVEANHTPLKHSDFTGARNLIPRG
jgi:TRAP-type C4-dicarboxylate transport system permease small subunit